MFPRGAIVEIVARAAGGVKVAVASRFCNQKNVRRGAGGGKFQAGRGAEAGRARFARMQHPTRREARAEAGTEGGMGAPKVRLALTKV